MEKNKRSERTNNEGTGSSLKNSRRTKNIGGSIAKNVNSSGENPRKTEMHYSTSWVMQWHSRCTIRFFSLIISL
jgi:hypothetical protein